MSLPPPGKSEHYKNVHMYVHNMHVHARVHVLVRVHMYHAHSVHILHCV